MAASSSSWRLRGRTDLADLANRCSGSVGGVHLVVRSPRRCVWTSALGPATIGADVRVVAAHEMGCANGRLGRVGRGSHADATGRGRDVGQPTVGTTRAVSWDDTKVGANSRRLHRPAVRLTAPLVTLE